jgi:hypothetical protein
MSQNTLQSTVSNNKSSKIISNTDLLQALFKWQKAHGAKPGALLVPVAHGGDSDAIVYGVGLCCSGIATFGYQNMSRSSI